MRRLFKLGATLSAVAAILFTSTRSAFSEEAPLSQSGNTDFALNLFKQQTKNLALDQNTVLSPCSAHLVLSMTLNGAAGKTRAEMAKVLGWTDASIDQLNAANAKIMQLFAENSSVKLEIANAIYADKLVPFKSSFVDLCKSSYLAEAHNENFSDPATVQIINAWCDDKTHGKIKKILNSLTKDEKFVLINAIYFKGAWQEEFAERETTDDKFTTSSGASRPIKMMHQQEDLTYFKGSDFQMVSLPYRGHRQRLCIFLPNKGVELKAFEAQLTHANWDKWMASNEKAHVSLSLPRFKIEYETLLKPTLKAMGMREAFSESADFSNMTEAPASISRVIQKTYMDVNEKGTEAAAVTAVVARSAMAMAPRNYPKVEFRVDRPFILTLVDNPTNEILFLGAIEKP